MNILRIIYEWPPPWDGLSAHPYELTLSQTKRGHKFHLFCGWWPRSGKKIEISGVTVHKFLREPVRGTLNITTSVCMFFYYLYFMDNNDIDMVHSHGHFGIWIYLYRCILQKIYPNAYELKVPLVVHFHNTVAGREKAVIDKGGKPKFISKLLAWPLGKLSDKWAIKSASLCIFVSEELIKDAVKYYNANPDKCFVVETGVNTDLFTPVKTEEKELTRKDISSGIDVMDVLILNHGAMVERKNIHLLVESLKYLPRNYKLLLAGPRDEKYMERVDKYIIDNNLTSRILKIGYVPYTEVQILFQASDIFVLPSKFEGLPKVVMQSLACNIPVLASGFRLKEDIVGLSYLTNVTAEEIAKGILEIIKNKINVDITKVRKVYSWDERASQIDDIYKNMNLPIKQVYE